MAFLILLEPRAGHFVQRCLSAQNGAAQRRTVEHRGRELFTDQVGGIVGVHTDLLQNDAPLTLHVGLGKGAVKEHIAEDAQRFAEMGVQTAAVETGEFLGGKGVDLAANGVHALCQLSGGAGRGALEEHMLDEMGRAALGGLLLPGTGGDPDAQCGRAHPGHPLRGNAHPIGQGSELIIVHNLNLSGEVCV